MKTIHVGSIKMHFALNIDSQVPWKTFLFFITHAKHISNPLHHQWHFKACANGSSRASSGASVLIVQLHASIHTQFGGPPAQHISHRGAVPLTWHLIADVCRGQGIVPQVEISHLPHKGVLVSDPQIPILVSAHDKHSPRADSVTALQVPLLPNHAIDPQLGAPGAGRPGDAVVGPVVGPEVVWQVDELVADPEVHLSCISPDGDHQLIVIAVAWVGDDSADIIHLRQDVHAYGEGDQFHGLAEVGHGITTGIFVLEVKHQRKQATRF